jgi:hypothetical protein
MKYLNFFFVFQDIMIYILFIHGDVYYSYRHGIVYYSYRHGIVYYSYRHGIVCQISCHPKRGDKQIIAYDAQDVYI